MNACDSTKQTSYWLKFLYIIVVSCHRFVWEHLKGQLICRQRKQRLSVHLSSQDKSLRRVNWINRNLIHIFFIHTLDDIQHSHFVFICCFHRKFYLYFIYSLPSRLTFRIGYICKHFSSQNKNCPRVK